MRWEVRFYLDEHAFKAGIVAYKETIQGDRNYVISWAQNRLKHSYFEYFDLVQK